MENNDRLYEEEVTMMLRFEPDPGRDSPTVVRMVVEIAKHSGNKYEFDETLGLFRLSRALYSPIHYPGDYGFIPGTIAEDGEPLDVLCLVSNPSFTGCLTHVRPVGVLDMDDGATVDHKVLAVPVADPRYDNVTAFRDVREHTPRELEHFFQTYKGLEDHRMTTRGWGDTAEAHRIVDESRTRYLEAHQ